MGEQSCYATGKHVLKGDLLVANEAGTDFNLTVGSVYVALHNQGSGTFHDCVFVKNDKGNEEAYSTEYFRPYSGEQVAK